MDNLTQYNEKTFENIKHIDEYGNEYWEARELQKVLEYSQWRRFKELIERAMSACKLSNNNVLEHFAKVGKPIKGGHGSIQIVEDYKLSRYACYLIVQNGDPKKEVIALGQTYFAVQTRKMELTEKEYEKLTEAEKQKEQSEDMATDTHYKVGKAIRKTIEELGGTMPEELPTPKRSLKEIEKGELKKLN